MTNETMEVTIDGQTYIRLISHTEVSHIGLIRGINIVPVLYDNERVVQTIDGKTHIIKIN